MSIGRLVLHVLRVLLALLLALQLLSVLRAWQWFDLDALRVSAQLLPALVLKVVLVLANTALLLLVHVRLRRGARRGRETTAS